MKYGNPRFWRGDEHASTCECGACMRKKLAEFNKRVDMMGGVMPPDMTHTIPVKPHWRRSSTYLKNRPFLKDLVRDLVRRG